MGAGCPTNNLMWVCYAPKSGLFSTEFENCRSRAAPILCAASSEAAAYGPRRGREAGAAGVRSEGDHDHDEKRELMTALTESFLRWVYFWPTPMNMMGWPVL